MSNPDDNYIGMVLEDIRDQNRKVLEAVGAMQEQVSKIPGIEAKLDDLTADVKVIKAAVTDQSRQLHDHEPRITRLEQRAA